MLKGEIRPEAALIFAGKKIFALGTLIGTGWEALNGGFDTYAMQLRLVPIADPELAKCQVLYN